MVEEKQKRKPLTEAQKKAKITRNNRYKKNSCTTMCLQFSNNTDADIIAKLGEQENKQGYIKQLIRDDIAKTEEV